MKPSFFLKSWRRDFPWLEYVRASIRKFAPDFFHEIVLVLPEGESFDWPEAKIHHIREMMPGYHFQMVCKAYADHFCEGDLIVFGDSDTIITRPLEMEDFVQDGKPIWLFTPLDNAREDQQSVWRGPMRDFIGKEPTAETMRRHCMAWPRPFFEKLRAFCRYKHGVELVNYIMSKAVPGQEAALTFSEFNCAGAMAMEYERDLFTWVNDKDARPAYVHQGHTWSGEKRKQEDIEKFRSILGADQIIALVDGDNLHFSPGSVTISKPGFQTTNDAIEFLVREARKAPVCKGRVLTALRKAGLVKRGKLMDLPDDAPVAEMPKQPGILLAIHSYPGANDCVARHWPYYYLSGATRIVGIGTTDGKCQWPVECESVNIGKNKYIDGPHLPQRLADTIEWCLTQPEDRFIIAEYDVLFFGGIPPWTGAMLHKTGGKLPDAKASQFMHNPWCLDRESGARLMHELRAIIAEGHCQSRWPEASPDVALGYAVDRLKLPYREMEHMFTRNSLEEAGALDLAVDAVRNGAIVVHGCKTPHAFDALVGAHKAKKRKKAA